MEEDPDRLSLCNIVPIFSSGYFSGGSPSDVLLQDAISDSLFLALILGLSCLYFLALTRVIASEKRAIQEKFTGIVQSVTLLNQQIAVLEQMIAVMKDTNRREGLYMRHTYVTKAHRGKKKSVLSRH